MSGFNEYMRELAERLSAALYYRGDIRAEDVRALGFEGTVVAPGDGAGSSTVAPGS